MKGLMPLTLSPAWTSSSPSLAGEELGHKVDGYFPELLAKDLDMSSSIFMMRNMTSGSPEPSLSSEDRTPEAAGTWSSRNTFSTLGPRRSLGPIQERNSVSSFLDQYQQQPQYEESITDHDSISGTDISRGVGAPSIGICDNSTRTTATSLSSSTWSVSIKRMPSREHSWIEPDSDEDEPEEMVEGTISALSPRPPTPPDSDTSNGAASKGSSDTLEMLPSRTYKRPAHRKSHSIASAAPASPISRRHSVRSTELSTRSPSHASRRTCRPRADSSSPPQRQRASSLQSSHRQQRSHRLPRTPITYDERPFTAISAPLMDADLPSDEEMLPTYMKKTTATFDFTRPSPPASPLPNVQSWLNRNGSYGTPGSGEDLSRVVPLSADVVETLRVTIACFPETMLLSSSLTIETIRNYSRKVRHPTVELLGSLHPDPPGMSPRKPFWKRVVPSKRSSITHPKSSSGATSHPRSSSSVSIPSEPKPWVSLKNVFGCCSDYICDALWAHIVAYNYISSIVPRTPARSLPSRGSTKSGPALGKDDMQKEDIPKKAATLLGLMSSPGQGDRGAKRGAAPWSLRTEADGSARMTPYDSATTDMQSGLMRCIRRLVATAKLMSEDGTCEDRAIEEEARDVDSLLVRSLCELVKVSEEAS